MAVFVPWLADAALLTGHPVVEVAGWKTRGHGGLTAVEGVVCHHTAGPAKGEYPSLGVVRDGRAGLPGPLAQLGIGRSGTIYVIAAGLSYHAGTSKWAGYTSLNSRFIGIEAESTGTANDWTPEQKDCYPRLAAALLHYMRRNASRCAGHKEIAPGRKIDPANWDMSGMRTQVEHMLGDPLNRIPRFGNSGGTPVAVRDDVWQAPIPDFFKGGQATIPAFAALGWSGTHAAFARAAAERAAVAAEAAVVALNEIKATLAAHVSSAPLSLSAEDIDRIIAAIPVRDTESVAIAVADELARRAQE